MPFSLPPRALRALLAPPFDFAPAGDPAASGGRPGLPIVGWPANLRRRARRELATAGVTLGVVGALVAAVPLVQPRDANPLIERVSEVDTVSPSPRGGGSGDDEVLVPPPLTGSSTADRLVQGAERSTPAAAEPVVAAELETPATKLPLPSGKGMWIWLPEKADGGDANAIVARAQAVGLTHIYVRTGSSRSGYHGGEFLDRLLPVAHEAGLRVYGWDFPYLDNPGDDVKRAMTAIRHEAPGGHHIDGFVADIETPSEGTVLTGWAVEAYGRDLRAAAGADYPLIVAVPRPSKATIARYPFDLVVKDFSAIAPMVYWLNRQPDTDVAHALDWLSKYGKPLIPIGQAYDGAPEGGRPGVPPRDELLRFMRTAELHGGVGVSFWSWQHADQEAWDAIRDAGEFKLRPAPPETLRPAEVKAVQTLLDGLGYETPATGSWDERTERKLAEFQDDAGLRATGRLDEVTRDLMLQPVPAPRP